MIGRYHPRKVTGPQTLPTIDFSKIVFVLDLDNRFTVVSSGSGLTIEGGR